MIRRYGAIHRLPDAAGQPGKDREYRIPFSIIRPSGKGSDPSLGFLHLDRTATRENAEIPSEHSHLVAIIPGEAPPGPSPVQHTGDDTAG